MKPFDEFRNQNASFWAFIKMASESLGYTDRLRGGVKSYSEDELSELCKKKNVEASDKLLSDSASYVQRRANLLNDFVESRLMDAQSASEEYKKLEELHRNGNFHCNLPLNKQKGNKKQIAFFTAIVNILAEKSVRELTGLTQSVGFDDNPRGLLYVWDEQRRLIGASSRRFDGAFPSVENPQIVWEIKEYYYATTFGSRVADGIYETLLDGYELKDLFDRSGHKVYHVLFIDAYRTWWQSGKSYLCRLVDAMNAGFVDEVIVGREALTRWPELLKSIITGVRP